MYHEGVGEEYVDVRYGTARQLPCKYGGEKQLLVNVNRP